LREHARVEEPCNVQINVIVAAQFYDRGNVIGIEEHRHLRLGVVDAGEHLGRRFDKSLGDFRLDLIDDVEILVEQHDRRQSADGGLDREELMELVARLVEQRLGARKLYRGGDALSAHELDLFAHVSVGDDQRVLDERLRLLGEQPVKAAVERHACNYGYQNCRNSSDNREQSNDANVKSRRCAPATPRLHNPPDLARNDHNEKKDGDRVGQEERDHDLVCWRNRREPGQHEECDQRGQ
jgi:hypothetical protein